MKLNLDRVDSRCKLAPRRDPYWQRLTQGRYVGFRLLTKGTAGTWLARFYDGEKYAYQPLGDFALLQEKERFDAAKKAADEWFRHLDLGGSVASGTLRSACEAYVDHMRMQKGDEAGQESR
jgi:hypothetical protein